MNDENKTTPLFPRRPSLKRDALWIAAIALIYFLTAHFSLLLIFKPEGMAAIWPTSGIFLCGILLTRRELRPWLVGVLFVTDFIAEMLAGTPLVVSLFYSLALTADAVLSAWLLLRFVGGPITFKRVRELTGWLVFSVIFSNALTSLLAAAASSWFLPGTSFWTSWVEWASSDAVGNLIVTPLILSWAAWERIRLKGFRSRRLLEGAALLLLMALLNILAFSRLSEKGLFTVLLTGLIFPFLLWAALRFGVRGVASAALVLAVIAIYFSYYGHFIQALFQNSPLNAVLTMQGYLAVLAIPALFLASGMEERQSTEQRLRESEEYLRLVTDNMLDLVTRTDLQGVIQYTSPSNKTVLGYALEYLQGKSVYDLVHPDDLVRVREFTLASLQAQTPGKQELRYRHADGHYLWLETVGTLFFDEGGCPAGAVFSSRDISERKQAEQTLHASEEMLKRSQAIAHIGSWELDIGTNRLTWSDEVYRMFGVRPQEFEGTNEAFLEFVHPDDRLAAQTAYSEALRDGRDVYEIEHRIVRRDNGEVRVVHEKCENLKDASGRIVRSVGMVQDITEPRRAQALQEAVYQIAAAAESTPSLEELYPQIHQIISSVMPAENFYIALYDEDQDLLRFPYIRDAEDEPFMGTVHPGKGVSAYVLRTGKSLLGTQAVHEDLERRGEVILLGVQSAIWLGVPLIVEGKPIGVMAVQHYTDPNAYGEREQHILEFVSSQVASAIQRVQADQALRESEQRLASIYETVGDVLYYLEVEPDEQYRFSLVNPAFLKVTGLASEQVNGRKVNEVIPEPSLSMVLGKYRQAIQEKAIVRWEETSDYPTGRLIGEVSVAPVFDKAGNCTHLVGSVQNITERKRAEEALQGSEQRFRDIADNAGEWIWEVDATGKYTYASQVVEKLLGYTPQELLQKHFYDLFHPEDRESLKSAALAAFAAKQPFHEFINRNVHKDGRTVWLSTSGLPMSDGQGNLLGYRGVDMDITGRKQLEQYLLDYNARLAGQVEERTRKLREAQEQLVRKEKLAVLGQLAGGVGHELRNPLGVISASVYFLKLVQPDASEKVRQHLAMIEQEVHNAAKIIGDLLDYGRVITAERKPVSVPDLVRQTLERFPVPAGVELRLELPDDLPDVFADPLHIEQVLGNLVTNAWQAMAEPALVKPAGSTTGVPERGLLTISAQRSAFNDEQPAVSIQVKDTGTGITPENMKQMFEPLFTTKPKGIGLGLAVSRKLAEANGGRIDVESEPGKGSTFTVYLPINV